MHPPNVTFSPDSTRAYVTNLDGTVAVINTATQTIATRITTPAPAANAAVTPDGTVLRAAGTDGTLRAIDTSTNNVLQTLQACPNTHVNLTVNTANTQLLVALITPRANSAPTPAPGVEFRAPEPVAGTVTGTVRYDDADGDTLTYGTRGSADPRHCNGEFRDRRVQIHADASHNGSH